MTTNFFEKRISIKSVIILILIIAMSTAGVYYGKKYYVKYEKDKIATANIELIAGLAKMVAPVDGRCQIVNLSYQENGQTKMEKVVNIACVNVPTENTPPPVEEPTVEIINP